MSKFTRAKISPAVRRSILEAQRQRWGKLKSANPGTPAATAATVAVTPTHLQKMSPVQPIPTDAKEAVRFWDNMAGQFARGSVASQVMCGFALIELREQYGTQPGRRTDLTSPNASERLNWADFVETTFNFTDDTASRRIEMAKGVKSEFKKLGLGERFRTLLSMPPSLWTDTDTKLLSDSLAKVTDGLTQTDFFRKLGLAKKPTGNTTHEGRTPPETLTAEQQAEALKKMALEDSGQLGNAVRASNRNFVLVDDLEINCQIALMEAAIKLRRAWTSQPKSNRDVTVIEKMLKESSQ